MSTDRLTAPQVAALAGCARIAVSKAIREGRLAATLEDTPRGPIYWIARADADAWAAGPRAWHAARAGKNLGGRPARRGKGATHAAASVDGGEGTRDDPTAAAEGDSAVPSEHARSPHQP